MFRNRQPQNMPAKNTPPKPDVATQTRVAPVAPAFLRVTTSDGKIIDCRSEPFNSGSEGRLYYTLDNQRVVKIYSRPEPWRQKSLIAIIKKREAVMGGDSAYWTRYFCWPEVLIMRPDLGMVMPRARPELRPFSHLLSPRFRQRIKQQHGAAALGTWIGHVGILMKLARTVNRLHANGLCHSDLSTNNLLVDPVRGDATLIDCDGLVETGSNILLPTVLGTPDYMAPELVVGMTAKSGYAPQPTVETDLHSLAVLMYQGLLFRHPLRGSKFHSPDPDEDERLMLGQRALYIEHPTDHSNLPKTPFLRSAILGSEMQNLFARAFTEGLRNPNKRPKAAEWERALVRMYDQTLPCSNPACEAKSFVWVEGGSARCPWCKTDLRGPHQIPIFSFFRPDGRQSSSSFHLDFRLVGWRDRTLHTWHLELNRMPGPGVDASPLARIKWEITPRQQEVWSLLNIAAPQMAEGSGAKTIAPGQSIELREGTRIIFGGGDRARMVEVHLRRL